MAKKEIEKKKEQKKETEKQVKVGFFKGMKAELSKVKWPESKAVVKYTVATLFLVLVLSVFFLGLNALSTLIKGLFS